MFVCLDSFSDFFPLFMPNSELLASLLAHSLFFKEQLEQFALCKRATVSDLLRLLMTKEQWERFAQVAHDKTATGAIYSFS